MLWQGAKWRILKNFNVQNEECHNYDVVAGTYYQKWGTYEYSYVLLEVVRIVFTYSHLVWTINVRETLSCEW
jgi:hypothetical protein